MPRDVLDLPAPAADRRLAYGSDPNQFIDFRDPAVAGPLVVHFHGGFWRNRFDLRHAGNFCAALTAVGIATANVEYRRVGDAGGGWPGTLDDALAALRFARSQMPGIATVVTGHSAGGHIALWLAAQEAGLSGAVALGPVACLLPAWERNLGSGAVHEFLRASPQEAPGRYRTACPSLHPAAVPRVLIHGTEDNIVPVEISRLYVDARAGDVLPPRLIELPGVDHFDVIDPRSAVWSTVSDTIRKLLSGE
jgi:acetyl esterase/lipase